ncbi:MAG: ABC transporter permease [Prevotellaceae bacterium]|jgi:ABC-type antimicrobial peptide transport system permease subunit|nr:ABC transporter permease [Prevotellaceae bacterium]
MIHHYLKIAFRNLWKYKNQTLISVVGLAVGFTCFAVAALWIRYEMTFDGFHKNSDRIYCVNIPNSFSPTGMSRMGPYPLAGNLKRDFPEIAHAIALYPSSTTIELEEVPHEADVLYIDSSFFGMFDVKLIEGSMDFVIPRSKKAAITREKALQLFGNESPLGKVFKTYEDNTICAVVTGLPKRSNYPFDILMPLGQNMEMYVFNGHTLVELLPGVDVGTFGKKLSEYKSPSNMTLTPLTEVRYTDPNIERDVKFQHIIIFSLAGSLLILCTLFNYLTVFVSRFRIRQRELALRIFCGASNRSLFALLSVEFIMSLIIALLLGLLFINTVFSPFCKLSGVKLELSSIYLEALIYITGIILISLLVFLIVLIISRRRTLNAAIRKSNKKLFRRISIAVQLIISIGFAFCTIVIVKQMYYLHNTDLGFAFKNRGSVMITGSEIDMDILNNKMQQIPEITETVKGLAPLIPTFSSYSFGFSEWDDKPEKAKQITMERIFISEQYLKYYDIKPIEGEAPSEKDADTKEEIFVLINESAAKALGWNSSVGKSFGKKYKVKGVIRNIYNSTPTASTNPVFYCRLTNNASPSILFKYNEGTWKKCRGKIEKIAGEEYPNNSFTFFNAEEEYDKFLKSENTLLQILMLISLVCVFICVFGFVSMVSLTCEERRKEIAIRKVSGATVKDILDIFFKEYLTLLAVGALIAFPMGYYIMRRWLEQYVHQTEISAWIYAAILLALILAIVLCVGGKVYKTSRENPVIAIKEN